MCDAVELMCYGLMRLKRRKRIMLSCCEDESDSTQESTLTGPFNDLPTLLHPPVHEPDDDSRPHLDGVSK